MRQTDRTDQTVGPQVIFGMDAAGHCTLSVGPGLHLLGLSAGELVGQNLFEVYRDDPQALRSLNRALAGETFTVEREFDSRLLSTYFEPVHDSDGTVTGVLGVATDVTDQRRMEAEVRSARQRAGLLADLSSTLSRKVFDLEEVLRVGVRSMAEVVGGRGALWLATPDRALMERRAVWPPGDEVSGADAQHDGAATGPSRPEVTALESLDAPAVTSTGSLRVPLRSRGLLLGVVDVARPAGDGSFTDVEVNLLTDVAERCALALDNALLMNAQKEAAEELVKFQALADASVNLIGISDNDDLVVYVNPRVDEYGFQIREADMWTNISVYADSTRAVEMRKDLDVVGRWSGDLPVRVLGAELTISADVFRIYHPATGEALGTAWIAQDVTEIRATEEALRTANTDLKQFKALVEASPDFIAIADLDQTVRYVNPPGRELIGMDPDVDVTSTTIADYLTPEGLEASLHIEQPAVIAHGHWEGESTLRNHAGPPIPVAITSFLIHDLETGQPFALATVQRDITERRAAQNALQELADQREALLTRLVDAQDAERARIAADVHDDPVQALAAVEVSLGVLQRRLAAQAPALLEHLEALQETISGATDRLRALLFDLEPPDLHHGLTGAIRRAAEEIFEGTTTQWTVSSDEEPDVPDSTRAVAYRVAMEALNNVRKHAAAVHVVVTIGSSEGGLEVLVADDGVGLGHEPVTSTPGHRGIFTMQDRAAVAGGWCTIRNREGGGTLVTTWLPGPSGT